MTAAERLTDSVAYHGEGAVWYEGWGGLKWVDMLAGDILSLDDRTGVINRQHVDSSVAAIVRPRASGGFIVATEREFAVWGDDGKEWSTPPLWDGNVRFNEGSCDPAGRFLVGSMSYEREAGAGSMWRLNLDGSTERVFGDVTISNGLAFTANGEAAYYIDTRTRRIDVFSVHDSELSDRRPFVSVREGVGNPDGLCVDSEGGVWVALYGGSAVHHYGIEGRLEDVIEVGAMKVTSCTFGGPALSTLYITTSRENLGAQEEPAAGAIFSADVGVVGVPVLTSEM
jgi:sugar lactone lactonase YvrE